MTQQTSDSSAHALDLNNPADKIKQRIVCVTTEMETAASDGNAQLDIVEKLVAEDPSLKPEEGSAQEKYTTALVIAGYYSGLVAYAQLIRGRLEDDLNALALSDVLDRLMGKDAASALRAEAGPIAGALAAGHISQEEAMARVNAIAARLAPSLVDSLAAAAAAANKAAN